MQTLAMNESFVRELTMDELNLIAGGAWSWKEFGRSTASGAVGGAIAGSFEGGVGAIPGAGIGAVVGAGTSLATGWW